MTIEVFKEHMPHLLHCTYILLVHYKPRMRNRSNITTPRLTTMFSIFLVLCPSHKYNVLLLQILLPVLVLHSKQGMVVHHWSHKQLGAWRQTPRTRERRTDNAIPI